MNTFKCKHCKKEFSVKASDIRLGKRAGVFCSMDCRVKNGNVVKTCINCGIDFHVSKSRAKLGRGKYCSINCAYGHKNKKKLVEELIKTREIALSINNIYNRKVNQLRQEGLENKEIHKKLREEKKGCTVCGKIQKAKLFPLHDKKSGRPRTDCADCKSKRMRHYNAKRNYGEYYEALYARAKINKEIKKLEEEY